MQKLGNVEGLDILIWAVEKADTQELAGRGAKSHGGRLLLKRQLVTLLSRQRKRIWTYYALSETAMIYMEYKMIPPDIVPCAMMLMDVGRF